MDKELALKVLDAILISSKRKINLSTLENFFKDFKDIDVLALLEEANKRYQNLGFFIYKNNKSIEILPRPFLTTYLINFFGLEENEQFNDLFEVLAIIAYGGPINIKKINQVRNKRSGLIIKLLLDEGLIKKVNNNYIVSQKFLNFFGFKSLKELPDYKKLRNKIRK